MVVEAYNVDLRKNVLFQDMTSSYTVKITGKFRNLVGLFYPTCYIHVTLHQLIIFFECCKKSFKWGGGPSMKIRFKILLTRGIEELHEKWLEVTVNISEYTIE